MSNRADKLGDGRTDRRTDGRTDAGNDNTRRPILASGNKACMDYMDPTVRCPQKAVKLNHSRTHLVLSSDNPLPEPMFTQISVAIWCHPGGGTRSENCWGCAAGHWKLDPKRSREKWYFGAKKIEFCEDLYPKDRFCVGGWEKTPQKDRARSCQSEKRGSKPRHICITHHIGSTPPGGVTRPEWVNEVFWEVYLPDSSNIFQSMTPCMAAHDSAAFNPSG